MLKLAVVAAGYLAAFIVACAAVAVRIATSGPDANTSSGMYAFGDAVVFTGVFGICSLGPTGAGLYLLRPYRRFWTVLASLVLALAVTGVAAVVLFAVGRHATASTLATLAVASVLRILAAPLLSITFVVFAVLCPYRVPRVGLLAGSAAEVAVSAYAAFVWFAPLLLDRV